MRRNPLARLRLSRSIALAATLALAFVAVRGRAPASAASTPERPVIDGHAEMVAVLRSGSVTGVRSFTRNGIDQLRDLLAEFRDSGVTIQPAGELSIDSMDVSGNRATVETSEPLRIGFLGISDTYEVPITWYLVRSGNGWLIEGIDLHLDDE
jgi:hypothetical protein